MFWLVPAPQTSENGSDTKLFDLAKSVHWIVDDEAQAGLLSTRRRKRGLGDDSDEEDFSGAPPVNDIYRQRQQKRVR
jgi:cleavage stimulation factor subunit 3